MSSISSATIWRLFSSFFPLNRFFYSSLFVMENRNIPVVCVHTWHCNEPIVLKEENKNRSKHENDCILFIMKHEHKKNEYRSEDICEKSYTPAPNRSISTFFFTLFRWTLALAQLLQCNHVTRRFSLLTFVPYIFNL